MNFIIITKVQLEKLWRWNSCRSVLPSLQMRGFVSKVSTFLCLLGSFFPTVQPSAGGSRPRHRTSVLIQFKSLLQVNSHITALEMKICICKNTQRYFRIIRDSFVTDVWSTAPHLWTCRQCLHYMYCGGWRPSSLARLTGVCSVSGATGSIFAFHWKPNGSTACWFSVFCLA